MEWGSIASKLNGLKRILTLQQVLRAFALFVAAVALLLLPEEGHQAPLQAAFTVGTLVLTVLACTCADEKDRNNDRAYKAQQAAVALLACTVPCLFTPHLFGQDLRRLNQTVPFLAAATCVPEFSAQSMFRVNVCLHTLQLCLFVLAVATSQTSRPPQ